MNPELGNNAGLLASVERIVDRLFNGCQESLSRIIEAKQVPVLREKFADGYVALFCRHRLSRDGAALWLFTCVVDGRHSCAFFHFAGFALVFMAERSGPDVGLRLPPVSHTRLWSKSTLHSQLLWKFWPDGFSRRACRCIGGAQ